MAWQIAVSQYLCNATGESVTTTTVADSDLCDWLLGERNISASVPIPPGLPPGEYTLTVTITAPPTNGDRSTLRWMRPIRTVGIR